MVTGSQREGTENTERPGWKEVEKAELKKEIPTSCNIQRWRSRRHVHIQIKTLK